MFSIEPDVSFMLERVIARSPELTNEDGQKTRQESGLGVESVKKSNLKWKYSGIFSQTDITTNFGKVPAHLIRVGDRIRTKSGLFLKVQAIREFKLDLDFIERHPDAMPVLIKKGAIDRKIPTQDVFLSGNQLVSLSGRGKGWSMVPAKELRQAQRSFDRRLGVASYFEFQFEETVDILCEGIWVRCEAPS